MTVLRELVASLGFQVDQAQWNRANAGVEKLKAAVSVMDRGVIGARSRFGSAGAAAGAFGGSAKGASSGVLGLAGATSKLQSSLLQLGFGLGIGALIKKMVTLASDANETDNILSEVFGSGGADEMKQWAQDTSKFMGRSEFTLRKNAGALGAMLEPMTGSADKAKEMSKNIGALAIDLASFFNTADDDALLALRAGLSGEAEPLRRYGIVLLDATLQEFAHTKGITKKIQAMTVAEKTELRYQFILANSTKAQGDAHRTMLGFANASRQLGDSLKDLGTRLGQKLLPLAGQLIVWGNNAIQMFLTVTGKSTIFEAALGTLAVAFAVLKAQAALALLGPLLGFAALALVVDDVNTLFTGGQSAIGRWLDEAFGVGTAQEFVDDFRASLEALQTISSELVDTWQALPDMVDWWDLLTSEAENVGIAIAVVEQRIQELVDGSIGKLANLGRAFASMLGFDAPQQQAAAAGRATSRGLASDVAADPAAELEMRRSETFSELSQRHAERRALREGARAGREAGDELGLGLPRGVGQVRVPSVAPATVSAPAAARAAAGGNTTTVTNGPINMYVGQGAGAADAARAARRVADAERRRTADAIKRGA